ncbi:hypothetical protein HY995_00855 [Candidatus Micrarchaeota archaeon]|nr:hypothetical protein [Candidatus Micrarchaeota archaeon]
MKAILEIGFADEAEAKLAIRSLGAGMKTRRSSVGYSLKGAALVVCVEAADFTALRAAATSALRDLRVVIDSISVAKARGKGR